jgi:BirA family biotin operon repressor/biotin-[acetyl-CoA-carboxylase] ligase
MFEALPEDLAGWMQATAARRGRFGDPAYYCSQTGSTNDVAAVLADRGAPEGAIVVASAQTAGRGRLGRTWFSPPGSGLYVSIVCRNPAAVPYLTLAGGVAVAEGIIAATGLPVEIKWPNDIVTGARDLRSPQRKLAGVLAEGASGAAGLAHVILGFGINIRTMSYPPELADRATSLEAEIGRVVEPGHVLSETLIAFAGHLDRLAAADSQPLIARWRALAPRLAGSPVEYESGAGRVAGVAVGIADDGALLVRVNGRMARVVSGEVTWK